MGKISPPSIKYIIKVKFTAEGVVEKPDVIGAIFGQTEGLLGEELELRELQKKGKIGRIEAELRVEDSKTYGDIEVPTSIDKTETTMIAAAVETIDRVGPCDAKFEIQDVEDVRSSKRQYIVDRAKALLGKLSAKLPESKEIEGKIVRGTKTAKVISYGEDKLAAGPDVEKSKEIIVVEGRADVISLLKAGIKNAIAMKGTTLPKTVKELSKSKDITLFVDGDRGGLLIVKGVLDSIDINKIARAPDGKEVEELTEKEIVACLRNAKSVQDFSDANLRKGIRRTVEPVKEEPVNVEDLMKTVNGKKKIVIVLATSRGNRILTRSVTSLTKTLHSLKDSNKKILALIIDGNLTARVLKLAERLGCKQIAAKNFSATSDKVKFLSF
ncbi:MAG: DNA primase [archaeon]|nr:MAG: DNA primase [archaeon]